MKKIITVIGVLLIIAGVSAPYVNGLVMEKIVTQTHKDINQINTETGSGMTIEIIDYDRGFFSSEIEWKVNFGTLATIYGTDEIICIDHAKHGLTGVTSTTSLEKNSWFTDMLNDRLGGNNPLNITTRYSLTGAIESLVEFNGFSFMADNETIDIHPGRIVTQSDSGLTHLISQATWEGLTIPDRALIEGFSMEYGLDKISTYIWAGDISYAINNIQINDLKTNFELKNFKGAYTLDFDEKKNILSTGGTLEIGNFGEGAKKVKDAYVKLDVNNIDAQGYEEFMKLYTQNMHSMLNNIKVAENSPEKLDKFMEERAASFGIQMMAAYEKFLKEGLQIKISDMRAQLTAGKITGNLELKLNQDVSFSQIAAIAMQPNLAFRILSLQSDLRFPSELAGSNELRLISPIYRGMKTGFFVKDGEYLVHNAQTQDGKLLLNGNEVVFN